MAHSNRAIHTVFIYTLLLASLCLADHTIRGLGHYDHHHRLARLDASNNTSSTSKSHASPSQVHTATSGDSNTSSDAVQTTTAYMSQTSGTQGVSTKSFAATIVSTASSSLPSSSVATSANAPSSTSQIPTKADITDIGTISQRRITDIIGALSAQSSAGSIPGWLSTLGANGMWPASEVNYTAGCAAQRANWPAQTHWHRITIMAAAWHGGLTNATSFVGSDALRSAISSAVGYWFSNDFTDDTCLDSGGLPSCPCGTPGLWNPNWFSNAKYVGQTCLMLNSTLLPSEVDGCSRMILRAYGTFDRYINGLGYITGANTLDMAQVGLDQGLRAMNISLITDAYARVHAEVVIHQTVSSDGIRPDGSFGQHVGILYNGNYGKDYLNADLDLETEAGDTQFAAEIASKEALATLLQGDLWMIYRNVITDVLHWDFSVLGRFISFPVADKQATGSINFNISEVQQLANQWQSDALLEVVDSLQTNTSDANSGSIVGNRMFYANDYMVQRGSGYITTVKIPLEFTFSDGTVYTYLQGNEYEDIAAAWDWNLIPGTTTDYAATPLNCNHTSWTGVQEFVGGVSDGEVGIAAMRYTNPYTGSLRLAEAWSSRKTCHDRGPAIWTNAPVYSVLDQKRHVGDVYVDGSKVHGSSNFTSANLLWHGGVGYALHSSPLGTPGLSVETGAKFGNWKTIGISAQPNITIDLFAAYLTHSSQGPVAYSVFPATASHEAFQHKQIQTQIRTVWNDAEISAIMDDDHSTAMVVFWDALGGSVTIPGQSILDAPVTITADGNSAIMYHYKTGNITVSDPSQTLTELQVALHVGLLGKKPPHWGWEFAKTFTFDLPTSGSSGSSVSQLLSNP
ncbi:polysaccharide lyase family 8 protein [Athelia psychrophila]|uniref:Polysaccharide lyase family 8 protein n=1 Tax=Athelia psychrophila TaxID=1759441 RepID=A0A166U4A7_9AGAM|nr:polysaccharide lyase family 8 protein [Fibularhizoctonia sp. CBS 109695]